VLVLRFPRQYASRGHGEVCSATTFAVSRAIDYIETKLAMLHCFQITGNWLPLADAAQIDRPAKRPSYHRNAFSHTPFATRRLGASVAVPSMGSGKAGNGDLFPPLFADLTSPPEAA
jgi:hypothetical protein